MLFLNEVAAFSHNHPQTILNNVATDLWGTELICITDLKDLKCLLFKEEFGHQNSAIRLGTAVF